MIGKIIWRLIPIGILIVGIRSGAVHGEELYNTVKETVMVTLTQVELDSMTKSIKIACQVKLKLPTRYTFSKWIKDNFEAEGRSPDIDLFGNSYTLKVNGKEYVISSRGPDGKPRTDDDLRAEVLCP